MYLKPDFKTQYWHDLCLTLIWKHVFKKRTKKNVFGSYFINKQVYLLVWMIDWDLKQQMVWTSQLFYLFTRLPLNLVLCFQKTPKICFLFIFFVLHENWIWFYENWKQKQLSNNHHTTRGGCISCFPSRESGCMLWKHDGFSPRRAHNF